MALSLHLKSTVTTFLVMILLTASDVSLERFSALPSAAAGGLTRPEQLLVQFPPISDYRAKSQREGGLES